MNNNTTIEKTEKRLARPLKVLVPMIKKDLQEGDAAARQAGMEYYIKAGEKLIEAKSQLNAMSWGDWLTRNFHLSQGSARSYMAAAQKMNASVHFETLSEARGDKRPPGHRPGWAEPVKDVLNRLDVEQFNFKSDQVSKAKERGVERKLALQLIDIGYKVLAVKMHPDKKDGSHDAMRRLNKVRARLKEAA